MMVLAVFIVISGMHAQTDRQTSEASGKQACAVEDPSRVSQLGPPSRQNRTNGNRIQEESAQQAWASVVLSIAVILVLI